MAESLMKMAYPQMAFMTRKFLTQTAWGWIPTSQVIVNAFDNDVETRPNQDVGFDGLKNEDEREFFSAFLIFFLRSTKSNSLCQS